MKTEDTITVHANCVAIDGNGLLIFGKPGSGKSTLTLLLKNLGADFVSDDRTIISEHGTGITAKPPHSIKGLIEARGVGILRLENIDNVRITTCLDLDQIETKRLPIDRTMTLLGYSLPCLHKVDNAAFPIALMHYLSGNKMEDK